VNARAIVGKAISLKGVDGRDSGEACRIDVLLRPIWVDRVGYRYDVILDGETIVCRSSDPGHDAARALLARGFRGRFRTIDFNTGRPRMIFDIEKAARLRVIEQDRRGLKIGRYQQMSDQDRVRLTDRSWQRGVIPPGELRSDSDSCGASRTASGHPDGSLDQPSVTTRTISGPERGARHCGDRHDAH
jgi:hypothetical protein